MSLVIMGGLGIGVALTTSDRVQRVVVPPATESVATPEPRSPEEERYVAAVLPLTERLVGEGRLLAELGATRSRNILDLRTRAERFRTTVGEIRTFEALNGVPGRLRPFSVELDAGIASALVAIDEAQAAVFRLDWEAVQIAVTSFAAAVDRIASTTTQVETIRVEGA